VTMKQPRGRQEPRRVGNAAMVVTMVVSLCVLTYIKARYCSNPFRTSPPLRFLLLLLRFLLLPAFSSVHPLTVPTAGYDVAAKAVAEVEVDEDYDSTRYKLTGPVGEEDFDPSRPTCYNTSKRSERCAAVGDIRVDGNHSRIYISPLSREWRTKPYARRHDAVAMDDVREFTLVPFGGPNDTAVPPLCTRTHSVPGFLFSSGGFAGNLYHDYADVLVPLFASTNHLGGEVQFLLADIKDWWADKFRPLFRQLSRYDVIDVNNDREVHCFPRIIIGSTFHRAMGIDPSRSPGGVTVADFKRLLRRAFRLERAVASRSGAPRRRDRPRLLIISRKSSRRFVNERAMARAAAAARFDVRIAEPDNHTDMPNFARLVNSADVMMGVHGAGLTNMVFLPSRAVLVQVVPFGGLEWLTRVTFKDPARDMDVTYMEYNVSLEESSLRDLYPEDHFYLKHPYDVHKKGWDAIKTVYLDKQNVRLNLTRFTRTLEQARDLLPTP
jgi:hypothetical protein